MRIHHRSVVGDRHFSGVPRRASGRPRRALRSPWEDSAPGALATFLPPACITAFASQRAQPLESLTALPINKKWCPATQPLEQILCSELL